MEHAADDFVVMLETLFQCPFYWAGLWNNAYEAVDVVDVECFSALFIGRGYGTGHADDNRLQKT